MYNQRVIKKKDTHPTRSDLRRTTMFPYNERVRTLTKGGWAGATSETMNSSARTKYDDDESCVTSSLKLLSNDYIIATIKRKRNFTKPCFPLCLQVILLFNLSTPRFSGVIPSSQTRVSISIILVDW